ERRLGRGPQRRRFALRRRRARALTRAVGVHARLDRAGLRACLSPRTREECESGMKVLWLSHLVPYPPAGGALQRAYNLLRHACRTHEVHLVALNQPRLLAKEGIVEAADALSTMCASVHVFPLPAERSHGHRLLCAARSVASGAPFDAVWLRSARLERHLSELRNGRRFELVHVDTVGLWPFVESWRRQPIILGHHNVESD